jgi:Protease inhibitor Inh
MTRMKRLLLASMLVFTPQTIFAQGAQRVASDDLLPLTSDATKTVAGQWDIAVPKNNLKCRIQLNITGKVPKANVGMPAPCRKSLAAVGGVQSWGLSTKGALRLIGGKGETVAEFSRSDAGVLKSTVGANDFTMEPMSGRYPSLDRIASVDAAVARLTLPTADNASTPVAVAGSYKLMRANNADTGCVLLLDRSQPGPVSQSGKASLDKSCADKGLLVFDPAGWIVERDRMFLYAKKGHRSGFNIEKDGRLVKDPPAGSPLSARKL